MSTASKVEVPTTRLLTMKARPLVATPVAAAVVLAAVVLAVTQVAAAAIRRHLSTLRTSNRNNQSTLRTGNRNNQSTLRTSNRNNRSTLRTSNRNNRSTLRFNNRRHCLNQRSLLRLGQLQPVPPISKLSPLHCRFPRLPPQQATISLGPTASPAERWLQRRTYTTV